MSTTEELLAQQKALLQARMAEVRVEIERLLHASAPKRAALAALNAQIADMTARRDALVEQISAIEQPQLHDLKMQLSQLAQAAGAIRLGGGEG